MPNLPSDFDFCALLSYATHPQTEDQKRSKSVSVELKQDKRYENPPCKISQVVAQRVFQNKDSSYFIEFFGPDVLAVPIPSSSLKKPGSLWVPYELALALKETGLVGDVLTLVKRIHALPKSATSLASERSKAINHYNSVQVTKKLIAPSSILLVDDVITRGATMLGIAASVMEAYPDIPIRGFAAMIAISDSNAFRSILMPCRGKITLHGDQTRRRP